MSDYNLEQPDALPHVQTETVYLCPAPSELAPARGSASWSKAEMHFEMAKAAMKLAARNTAGAQMAAEHLERAAKTLREITPNVKADR